MADKSEAIVHETLAEVVVMPASKEDGGRDDYVTKAKQKAADAKAAFTGKVRNATVKADLLLKNEKVLAAHARAVAGLMLIDVLSGVVQPKDAKQAMEIAQMGLEIARAEGFSADMRNLSPEDAKKSREDIRADLNRMAAEILDQKGIPLPGDPALLEVSK